MVKKVYLNTKQLTFGAAKQPRRVWIGGRGSGKSVMIGVSQRQKIGNLPRAKFFFSSSTYTQLLTKTLPPITKIWNNFGLIEHIPGETNGHYVVGKVPPKKWIKPYDAPRKYTNVITFINGYTIELLSMDRPEIARGGSYDGGEIDEAALVKREVLGQVLAPSIRGNTNVFSHWSHQQLSMYTSMPWKSSGLYLLEYEDRARLEPNTYFYLESTAYDNVLILGQKSLDIMKAEMDVNIFDIEIMNKRHGKSSLCFYAKFDDDHHIIDTSYEYEEDDIFGITVKGESIVNKDMLIDMSFDFGGWFTGCTIYQEDIRTGHSTEYMKDAMHVGETKGINDLIDAFCMKYAGHVYKHVRIWGEPRGHDKNATGYTYYEQLESRLRKHGWNVQIAVTSAVSENHENRYEFVNTILDESNPGLPKFRISETCKDVVIALHNTEVTPDFKKNKKDERNHSFNQAHATHYTDTVDYYLMQKHGWKVHFNGMGSSGGMVIFN